MWAGKESVREVSDYAANLPRGGSVGEWFGGSLAVSAEVEAVWELTHVLAQVNSKKKIKPRPMPVGVRDEKRKVSLRDARLRHQRNKK